MGLFDSFRQTINSGMAPIRQAGNAASDAVTRGLGPTHPYIQLAKKIQSDGPHNMGLMANRVSDAVKYQMPGIMRDTASSARQGIQDMGRGIQEMASNARNQLPSIRRFW